MTQNALRTLADRLGLEERWEIEVPLSPSEVAARLRASSGRWWAGRKKLVGSVSSEAFSLRTAHKARLLSVDVDGSIEENEAGSLIICRSAPSGVGIAIHALFTVGLAVTTAILAARAVQTGDWGPPGGFACAILVFLVMPLFVRWDAARNKKAICNVLGVDVSAISAQETLGKWAKFVP
jgi:hypothetical protein